MHQKIMGLINKLPQLGETAEEENPKAYLRFVNQIGRGEWYAIEMSIIDGDMLMFGYVKSPLGEDCDEFGTFTLNQLLEVNNSLGFDVIDLDLQFKPCKIQEILN